MKGYGRESMHSIDVAERRFPLNKQPKKKLVISQPEYAPSACFCSLLACFYW